MLIPALSDRISSEQKDYFMHHLALSGPIVVLTHQNPDGDAVGSSLAMRHFLHAIGKTDVTNIVPTSFPDFLAWMPGTEDIVLYESQPDWAARKVREAELVICTDLAEAKRVAGLEDALASRTKPVLIIDHHLSAVCTEQPWQIAFPDCASASELVFRVVCEYVRHSPDAEALFARILTPEFATCIYTGMMTDTGNFSYNSCHPEMYTIIATLLTTGINKDAIYDKVFNAYSADRMRLIGYCLYHKMRLYPEYHTAVITLDRKEMYRFNAKSGDMEGIVNMPLQIKDVYYSVFLREDKIPPHQREQAGAAKVKVKMSFRSQGDRPVNSIARECFHGGGHMNAAGGEFFGAVGKAAEAFEQVMPKFFRRAETITNAQTTNSEVTNTK